MKTLTIKTKIVLTNCLVLALLIILSLIVTRVLSHNSTVITKVNTLEYPSLTLTSSNLALLKEAFERFNVAVTLGDEELLANNLKVKSQINSNLQALVSHKPELQNKIQGLSNNITQYFTNADTLAKTMIHGNADMAKAAAQAQRNNTDYESITAEFEALHTQNTSNLENSIQQLVEKNASTVTLVQLACIISVLFTAFIAYLLVTGIRNDLQVITDKMKDIASGDGDLRVRLEYHKDDELKELVSYFNSFVSKLHDNIRNVVVNTDTLSSISNNLLEANGVAKTISGKQLAAMDEVASAVTE
ncbi:MAG: HAMP domain-containing protein, partial [Shewanella sp.]